MVMHEYFTVSREGVFDNYRIFTLFTSAISHIEPEHLLFNMLFFWFIADDVERVYGRLNFFVLYFFCGAVASLAFIITAQFPNEPALGASGAIMGVALVAAIFRSQSANLDLRLQHDSAEVACRHVDHHRFKSRTLRQPRPVEPRHDRARRASRRRAGWLRLLALRSARLPFTRPRTSRIHSTSSSASSAPRAKPARSNQKCPASCPANRSHNAKPPQAWPPVRRLAPEPEDRRSMQPPRSASTNC